MLASVAALAILPLGQAPFKATKTQTFQGVRIIALASGPGNLIAASRENSTIQVIDAATKRTVWTLSGHPQPAYGVRFSPDGRWLATGDETARIFIWDLRTGKKVREFPREKGHKRGIQSIAWQASGSRFATVGKDDVIHLWSLSGGNPTGTILGVGANFYGAWFAPNGNLITGTLKEGVRIYNGKTLQLASTMTLPGGQGANDFAMNTGGTLGVTAGRDGRMTVWNLATRQRTVSALGHQDWAIFTAMAPSGRVAATSSNDRTIKFWDIRSGASLATLNDMSVVGSPIAFSGNGRFFAAANMGDELEVYEISPAQPAASRPR